MTAYPVIKGYNSHGQFAFLKEILRLEKERGNPVDPLLRKLPSITPAIWICLNRANATRYARPSEDWDKTPTPEELARVQEIDLTDGQIWTSMDDGDEGYLFTKNL